MGQFFLVALVYHPLAWKTKSRSTLWTIHLVDSPNSRAKQVLCIFLQKDGQLKTKISKYYWLWIPSDGSTKLWFKQEKCCQEPFLCLRTISREIVWGGGNLHARAPPKTKSTNNEGEKKTYRTELSAKKKKKNEKMSNFFSERRLKFNRAYRKIASCHLCWESDWSKFK